jgi:hypothetical protein
MSILTILIGVVLAIVLVWAVNTYLPHPLRMVLSIVVVVILQVALLFVFGFIGPLTQLIGRVRGDGARQEGVLSEAPHIPHVLHPHRCRGLLFLLAERQDGPEGKCEAKANGPPSHDKGDPPRYLPHTRLPSMCQHSWA